jgi:small-conductance mechanosensitive channel
MINNFKDLQNILNISLPTFSSKDSQVKKYQDILYTIDILIKSTRNLYKNSNSSISKFNSLKNQINLFNDSFEKNTKKNMDKMTQLKMQNIQMKNILNQNISFLKELREENSILKTRNLNLEKNINLISKSRENLRNKILGPIKINYLNNNNSFVNRTYDNINNISINTTKTNKTTTDILIEEFQDKENKMQHLHEIANNLCNENKDIK